MKKLLKLLWKELTRVRAVQFVSYETTDEYNARLLKDFKAQRNAIKVYNYRKLVYGHLIPYCRDLELAESGLLLTNDTLFERANQMFLDAKREGRIDELNRLIKE